MKKALVCLLAITLVLFSLASCKNETPIPNATPEQLINIIKYQAIADGVVIQNPPLGGVEIYGDTYNFTNVELKNSEEATVVLTLNGSVTVTEGFGITSCNISIKEANGTLHTLVYSMKPSDTEVLVTIDGEKCIVKKPVSE